MSESGQIQLSELWQPAFNSVWNDTSAFVIGRANRGDMPSSKYDEIFLQGGRASGKSTFAATFIWLALENDPDKNAVVIRKVGSSLRKSCWKQMMKIRNKLEYWHWEPNKTEMVFTNVNTGQQIFFVGLDDEEKVRSITVEKGYIAIAWFEEAKQFKNVEEIDQAVASLLRGGADEDERDYDEDVDVGVQEYMTILTYNPPKSGYEWINKEARRVKKNRLTHKSTYLTMPKRWLGRKILAEIEAMKERNPKQYRHMYLGEITGVDQQFFTNIHIRKITDEEIKSFKWMDFGIDWGDIDPNVWGAFYLNDGKLFIFDEIYQEGKSKNKIFEFAKAVRKKMERWGLDEPIWADAQGKAQCQVLNSDDYRLNVKDFTPKQGKNGRTEGGNYLKSLVEIVIDPERCPHFAEQMALFEHKEAPKGEGYLDEPSNFGDHCFDCCRYGCNKWIAKADFNNEIPIDEWSSLSDILNTQDDDVDSIDLGSEDLTEDDDMW